MNNAVYHVTVIGAKTDGFRWRKHQLLYTAFDFSPFSHGQYWGEMA